MRLRAGGEEDGCGCEGNGPKHIAFRPPLRISGSDLPRMWEWTVADSFCKERCPHPSLIEMGASVRCLVDVHLSDERCRVGSNQGVWGDLFLLGVQVQRFTNG